MPKVDNEKTESMTNEQRFRYLKALDEVKTRNGLDWALVMITDVISEHSILLSTAFSSEKQLPYSRMDEHVYDMPGVMSRKKQLLPEIINAI